MRRPSSRALRKPMPSSQLIARSSSLFQARTALTLHFMQVVHVARLSDKLELIFVGGLVPYKACDLALRAAASLLRTGRASFTIVGDGPERASLDQLAKSLG